MQDLSALSEHGLEISWKWLNLPRLLIEEEAKSRRLPFCNGNIQESSGEFPKQVVIVIRR